MIRKIIPIFAVLVCAADMTASAAAAPRWISGDTAAPEKPAPVLAKEFALDAKPAKAVFDWTVALICLAGIAAWHWNPALLVAAAIAAGVTKVLVQRSLS